MVLLLMSCAGDDPADELRSGDYEVSTVAMRDDCLDGALEALFMPEGPATPHIFEFPIFVPAVADTPMDQELSLREPFVSMPVHIVHEGQGRLSFSGAVMEEVLLDEGLYGDCASTMVVETCPTSTAPRAAAPPWTPIPAG
jgi:hypothetical protein